MICMQQYVRKDGECIVAFSLCKIDSCCCCTRPQRPLHRASTTTTAALSMARSACCDEEIIHVGALYHKMPPTIIAVTSRLLTYVAKNMPQNVKTTKAGQRVSAPLQQMTGIEHRAKRTDNDDTRTLLSAGELARKSHRNDCCISLSTAKQQPDPHL